MAEKILIIDDDVDTLRLVGLMLQRQGYEIVAATNGQQGLDKALEDPPNLILLDVMMPDMDGYEVARHLRGNQVTVNIPILMFTAKTQLDDKVAGFEVGADDYLTKPTHPSELQAHVKALLTRSKKSTEKMETAQLEQRGDVLQPCLYLLHGLDRLLTRHRDDSANTGTDGRFRDDFELTDIADPLHVSTTT